ncbi:MAG: P-loop NTPase family protein [Acidobacteriaceae bacterium]
MRLTAPEHTRAYLTSMASESYWYKEFRIRWGESGSLSWPGVASDLMAASRNFGIYDPARLRGRGVWRDGENTIVHLGDRLIVNSVLRPLVIPESRHIYEIGLPLIPTEKMPIPLSNGEAIWVEKIVHCLRWEKKTAARLFAGWIALAPICGALDWRPSIWLTGPAGAGKSWIAQHIVRRLLGAFSIFVELSTTEAGLRRLLQTDALPVIFDEAEKDSRIAAERMTALMGLVRQASTNSDGVVVKAGPSGTVDSFHIRSMFCWQSVNTSVTSQADMSRTEILELRDSPSDGDVSFDDLKTTVAEHFTDDFGPRLIARSISLISEIRFNAGLFSNAIAALPNQTRRRADQIGVLLAGAYSLHSRCRLTPEEARKFASEDEWVVQTAPLTENRDEIQLLAFLMAHKIRIAPNDITVGRLVESVLSNDPDHPIAPRVAREALLDIGIKVLALEDRPGFAISTSHPALKSILSRTPWATAWARSLSRIQGTIPSAALPTQRFGPSLASRAVWLPATLLGE